MLLVDASSGPSPIHRLGLFANEFIPVGCKIAEFREGFDLALTQEQVGNLPPAARDQFLRHAFFSPSLGRYLCDGDDGRFTNHSDTPNSRQIGLASYAIRDVAPGEEITLDYSELGAEPPTGGSDQTLIPPAPTPRQHGWAISGANGEPGFYIDRTKVGWGLFIDREVKAGERLLIFSGPEISLEQTLDMGHFGFYAVQVGLGRYIDVRGNGAFVNHSCQPSCSIRGSVDLVALRDLRPGTEVTMDYSMSMLADPEKMECRCGSPLCRRQIGNFDELPLELQRECLNQGVVSDFIVEAFSAAAETHAPARVALRGIPMFPEFSPWSLAHMPTVGAFARCFPPYNDFSFTTLHMFDDGTTELSNVRGNLLLQLTDPITGERSCTLLGDTQTSATIADILAFQSSQPASNRASLRAIPEEIAHSTPDCRWEEELDLAEYVYSTDTLLNGSSASLRSRHRFARRFVREHPHAIILSLDLADSVTRARLEAFACRVMMQKGVLDRGLLAELRALVRCLAVATTLGCIGFGLAMGEDIAGFIVIEPVDNGWYHAHFNKARRDLPGAMEFLMIETARKMHALGYRFQNDHEDLGLPGLRRFKESWEPVRLLKKYRLQ